MPAAQAKLDSGSRTTASDVMRDRSPSRPRSRTSAPASMVILVDDEDRENEGDLCMAAEKVTPEAINFMAQATGAA